MSFSFWRRLCLALFLGVMVAGCGGVQPGVADGEDVPDEVETEEFLEGERAIEY